MKLSTRLLWTIASARTRSRVHPGETAVMRWRVLPDDLDLFGHMTNSRYPAVMDLGRIDFLLRLGVTLEVIKQRWTIPVGNAEVDFKRELKLFEPYELRTRIAYYDDVWFYMEQQFVRQREPFDVVATGYVKTLFRNERGPIPTKRVMALIERCNPGMQLAAPPPPTPELCRRFGIAMPRQREPLAIVGIGCRLPGGAENPDALWDVLRRGQDCIVDIPDSRWDAAKFHDPKAARGVRAQAHRGKRRSGGDSVLEETPWTIPATSTSD